MKKTGRILSVILLTAIYCYAIGVFTKSLIYYDLQSISNTEQEKYSSSLSITLFSHTSPSEISVNSFPVPSFKNPFNGHWAITKTIEQLFETEFSQFTNLSKNFLIEYRKADIIFPFHYFW